MNSLNLENTFANLSFLCLLIAVLLSWSNVLLKKVNYLGSITVISSNFFLTSLLLIRWINSQHIPISNLYESLMFLCWSLTLIYLILDYVYKIKILGFIITPTALLINAYATLSLPADMQQATPLIPALKSNWLMMHVTVMILSYSTLILGSLLSITFLFLTINKEPKIQSYTNLNTSLIKNIGTFSVQNGNNILETIDNLSYRILGFGFLSLTLGIISGAVWANEAWGSYWSWDPKETWALVTWLVFASYFHTRLIKKWTGKKPALLATLGFFVVWICYLGVNLLGKGLHSYGWIN